MAIPNYSSYKNKLEQSFQTLHKSKTNFTTVSGRMHSLWRIAPDPGNIPSISEAPDFSTIGSFGQANSLTIQRIAQVECTLGLSGSMFISDRLCHQGGLSGVITTAQTTNLPTAPLTRYTSGEGVFMALEIYTAVGTTATTVTASYTNSQGVSGRTSGPVNFGGTAFREVARLLVLPLQQGDTGVRSVQSITILASTGTAGDFGVTLFKPLMTFPVLSSAMHPFYFNSILGLCGNIPQVENNACLQWMLMAGTSASGTWLSSIKIIEE